MILKTFGLESFAFQDCRAEASKTQIPFGNDKQRGMSPSRFLRCAAE